jgi:hypothetical protein
MYKQIKKMKEKKGKKSLETLETLDNSLKRSTRLKEFAKSLPNQLFGTNSTSIQTISFSNALPPSYFISGNSKPFCEKVGRYVTRCGFSNDAVTFFILSYQFVKLSGTGAVQEGVGWRFNREPGDFRSLVPGAPSFGWLFVYFEKSSAGRNCGRLSGTPVNNGGVCSIGGDEDVDDNQGEIFAVVISNIAQINALNRTLALQTGGNFLSNTLNDALKNNVQLSNDMVRLRRGDTTIIRSARFVQNPITTIDTITEIQFSKYTNGNPLVQRILIPLSDLIRFDRFNDFATGSGIFTVKRSTSIMYYSFEPNYGFYGFFTTFKPNIFSEASPKDELLLYDEGYNTYVEIQKAYTFGSPPPTSVFFTLTFNQPEYFQESDTETKLYPTKTLSLNFRVTF